MKYWLIAITAFSIVSCNTTGDDSEKEKPELPKEGDKVQVKDTAMINIDVAHEVVEEKELESGIKIKWFTHGDGELVTAGDMVNIDYKVYLENGEIIDGNHLMKRETLPFMVGFQMQTEGWDIALQEMRIGDFAEVFLPAKYARGSAEIDGLIPKNSNNILKIHVVDYTEPTNIIDGTRIWLMNENEANKDNIFDESKRVLFHCWVSSPSNPLYYNSEWQNNPYNYGIDDKGLVPGLSKALINAKKADLMFVHIPAEEAYGSKGYRDIVKPNEDLLYRVFVMEVRDK